MVWQASLWGVLFSLALSNTCLAGGGNVFGKDSRTPTDARLGETPYSRIAYVDGGSTCTGTLVGRNLLLTAVHCFDDLLFFHKDGRITFTREVPIRMGCGLNMACKESATATEAWIGTEEHWADRGNDWAILKLDRNLGDTYGFFDVVPETPDPGTTVLLAGFSADIKDTLGMTVAEPCQVQGVELDSGIFLHDCDSARGSSGSSILRCDPAGGCVIAGLHVAERRGASEQSLYVEEYTDGYANVAVRPLAFHAELMRLRALFPDGSPLEAKALGQRPPR